jgi:broad specificity phosphatase PhoE
VKFPRGESLSEVRARTSPAIDGLIAQHTEETIVVVSHKLVCQVIILSLLDLDNSHFWQIGQDVCAMNFFEVRGGIPAALWINDTCHARNLN